MINSKSDKSTAIWTNLPRSVTKSTADGLIETNSRHAANYRVELKSVEQSGSKKVGQKELNSNLGVPLRRFWELGRKNPFCHRKPLYKGVHICVGKSHAIDIIRVILSVFL